MFRKRRPVAYLIVSQTKSGALSNLVGIVLEEILRFNEKLSSKYSLIFNVIHKLVSHAGLHLSNHPKITQALRLLWMSHIAPPNPH